MSSGEDSERPGADPPKLLIVSFSPISMDPRVLRQIDALHADYRVTVAGFGPFADSRVTFRSLGDVVADSSSRWNNPLAWQILELVLSVFRLYSVIFWVLNRSVRRFRRVLEKQDYDIILANDTEPVPVVRRYAKPGTAVVHDQHEYWPGLFINPYKRWGMRGYRDWLTRNYLSGVCDWSTVARGIGDLYVENFQLTSPEIITNAPGFVPLTPSLVKSARIDLVYHGIWDPARGTEVMIEALALLDQQYHLNFMIVGHGTEGLRALSQELGVQHRVHFIDPVEPKGISNRINEFDVALILNMPVNPSERFALPNKLFESIQGRLALVVGPSPEIERVVVEHDVGRVLDDFTAESLARELRDLSPEDITAYKNNSDRAASSLCAEQNALVLKELLSTALGRARQ